ncbi:MAG TPA: hypothetical protein VIU87_06230 [Mycobacterium sp.]
MSIIHSSWVPLGLNASEIDGNAKASTVPSTATSRTGSSRTARAPHFPGVRPGRAIRAWLVLPGSLESVVDEVLREHEAPEDRLRELIRRFVAEYAVAQNAQRVLTEDVRFLSEDDQSRIVAVERRVVAAFARTIAEVRGDDPQSRLGKPMAMLPFGMINWPA